MTAAIPTREGLYDPQFEHDSCGVSFACDISGAASHRIVALGIRALCNLEHRGALGADPLTGDGAGILIQVPDRFLRDSVGYSLPPPGCYATGIGFLPAGPDAAEAAAVQVEAIVRSEGLEVIGWRDVPVDDSRLGVGARAAMPSFRQLFIAGGGLSGIDLDRRAYIVRKRIEHEIGPDDDQPESAAMGAAAPPHTGVYFPSLSARTLVYKGMLISRQLTSFYPDLRDERVESALALVHSRFSTNTFPSWPLAHPYRMIAHNGEINAIKGNRNWMRAREALLSTPLLDGLKRAFPICTPDASDTAGFDEVLELLTLGGYSPAEAVLMMIPEPWEHHHEMSAERKAFYRYHAARMEPWDGPASIAFTDGTVIGAVLDRNGLRPSRYLVTSDGLVGDGLRSGRARHRAEHGGGEGPLAARSDVLDRHLRGAHSARRRDQSRPGRGPALSAVAGPQPGASRRPAGPGRGPPRGGLAGAAPTGVRAHPRGAPPAAGAHGRHRQGGHRLDGHRHAARGAV